MVFERGLWSFLYRDISICIYTYGLLRQYRFLRMGSNPGMNSNPGWRNWGQTVMVRLAGAFAAGPKGRAAPPKKGASCSLQISNLKCLLNSA